MDYGFASGVLGQPLTLGACVARGQVDTFAIGSRGDSVRVANFDFVAISKSWPGCKLETGLVGLLCCWSKKGVVWKVVMLSGDVEHVIL